MLLSILCAGTAWAAVTPANAAGGLPDYPVSVMVEGAMYPVPDGLIRWHGPKPEDLGTWYSRPMDPDGRLTSSVFAAPARLVVFLAGHPHAKNNRIWIEDEASGEELTLDTLYTPLGSWKPVFFDLPEHWHGKPVRLLAEHKRSGPGMQFGFGLSEPLRSRHRFDLFLHDAFDALRLIWISLGIMLLLFLPAGAACMLAHWRGVRNDLDLLATAIVGASLAAYFSFWLYFGHRVLGWAYSLLVVLSSAYLLLRAYRSGLGRRLLAKTDLWAPGLLVVVMAFMVSFAGYMHGGLEQPLHAARARLHPSLPGDNRIPLDLADMIYSGERKRPLGADWLSSDRPPLQAAFVLYQYPLRNQLIDSRNQELHYQLLGTLLQSLWIAALWFFLRRLGVSTGAIALILASLAFSYFIFQNSFFVWPKLLPAAYLLVLSGYLFDKQRLRGGGASFQALLVGSCAALAMLGHGASAFALLGGAVTLALVRRIPAPRFSAIALGAMLLVYSPWLLYQKYYDPPGNRLVKLHLAGVEAIDGRSSLRTITDSYRALDGKTFWSNKFQSYERVKGDYPETLGYLWQVIAPEGRTALDRQNARVKAGRRLTHSWFYGLFQTAGWLVLGMGLMCVPWRRAGRLSEHFRLAWLMIVCTGLTVCIWVLVLFPPGSTAIHLGSYLPVILGFAGLTLGAWSVSRPAALAIVGLNIATQVFVVLAFTPFAGFDRDDLIHSSHVFRSALALPALVSATAMLWILGQLSGYGWRDLVRRPHRLRARTR